MVIWLGILIGLILGFFMFRMKKFIAAWALLLNVLIAIYIGVMVTPTLAGLVSELGQSRYNIAPTVFVITVLVYALLHFLTNNFLSGKLEASFPQMLSTLGSGVLGFIAGFIATCFVFFVVYIMPFSANENVGKFIGRPDPDQLPSAAVVVTKGAQFINSASMQVFDNAPAAVSYLMDMPIIAAEPIEPAISPGKRTSTPGKRTSRPSNEPNKPAAPPAPEPAAESQTEESPARENTNKELLDTTFLFDEEEK